MHPDRAPARARRSGPLHLAMALLLTFGAAARAQQPPPDLREHLQEMTWQPTLFVLFDQLDYAAGAPERPLNVDMISWYGSAVNRLWVLGQGEAATAHRQGEAEARVLYGRLVDPFWDAVVGVRVDKHWGDKHAARALLAVGLVGLAPYRFELEPMLFVSPRGELSARLEASYPVLITQRLIAEAEAELNAALQRVPAFGVTRGINDYEYGVRVRYEFRRELAPYIGWARSRRAAGAVTAAPTSIEPVVNNRLVVGLRLWR